MALLARLAVALCLAGSVGCARNAYFKTDVDRTIEVHSNIFAALVRPPPTSDQSARWRLGQWALYKRTENGALGYERRSVVSIDLCGIWLEDTLEAYDHRWTWTFCVRHGPMPTSLADALNRLQVVIERWDAHVSVYDFGRHASTRSKSDYEQLLARFVPGTHCPKCELPPEDVAVAAGRFVGANHERTTSQDGTLDFSDWYRSDVLFDGTIKEVENHGHFSAELIDYHSPHEDESWPGGIVSDLATQLAAAELRKPPPSFLLELGYAFGRFSGHGVEASSDVGTLGGAWGTTLTRRLDVAFELLDGSLARYSPNPTLSEDASLYMGRVRYFPFGPSWSRYPQIPGASALYLSADAGYAELDLSSATSNNNTTLAKGFAAGLSAGWMGVQAEDWSGGIGASDRVAFFNHGEGTRNSLGVMFFLELRLSPFAR